MLIMMAYYIAFPIIILLCLIYVILEKREIQYLKLYKGYKKNVMNKIAEKFSRLKKMGIIIFIIFILFIPIWSYSASIACDYSLHREMYGGMTIKGPAYTIRDPVIYSIGPTTDIEKAMEEMDERPRTYLPDDLKNQIDFNNLTKFPGRLALYRLYGGRLIVTYSYIAPYPMIKAFGFLVNNPDTQDPSLIFIDEKTIIYPMSPGAAGRLAT